MPQDFIPESVIHMLKPFELFLNKQQFQTTNGQRFYKDPDVQKLAETLETWKKNPYFLGEELNKVMPNLIEKYGKGQFQDNINQMRISVVKMDLIKKLNRLNDFVNYELGYSNDPRLVELKKTLDSVAYANFPYELDQLQRNLAQAVNRVKNMSPSNSGLQDLNIQTIFQKIRLDLQVSTSPSFLKPPSKSRLIENAKHFPYLQILLTKN